MNEIEVIVLDDESYIAEGTCNAIKDFGYVCYAYSKSEEAFEHLKASPVNILVLDINLGESLDGIELIPKFKQLNPKMVIIMLTGEYDIKMGIKAMQAGAIDYIIKPINIDDLIIKLQEAVALYL